MSDAPKKVVFVLGAGSSCMYGGKPGYLPTAPKLKRLIIDKTELHDTSAGRFPGEFNILQENARALRQSFDRSGQESIDRFLELNPGYIPLGKRLIATALLPLEAAAIESATIASDWYQWLFLQLFRRNKKQLHTENLTIITFNYDRTLEFALDTMLANSRGELLPRTQGQAGGIPIHHVHGKLASLALARRESSCYEFSDPLTAVPDSVKTLRIVPNALEVRDDAATAPIRKALMEAQVLVFLGFSFDADNLVRVGGGPLPVPTSNGRGGIEAYVCTFGMGKKERETAITRLRNSQLGPELIFPRPHQGPTAQLMKAGEFVKEMLDLRGWLQVED